MLLPQDFPCAWNSVLHCVIHVIPIFQCLYSLHCPFGLCGPGRPCHAFLTLTRRLVNVIDWLSQVPYSFRLTSYCFWRLIYIVDYDKMAGCFHEVAPPSTNTSCPVTQPEAPLAHKNSRAPLTSSGFPIRPKRVSFSNCLTRSGCW